MTPLPFVWPYALLFWALMIWSFWPEFGLVRRAWHSRGPQDAKTTPIILIGLPFAFMLAYPLAWVRALQFSPAHRLSTFLIGLGVLVAGSLLRRHCFRMLGASFTGDVRAAADQEVVTRGAYAILRHPSYTAGLLVFTGVGLALGSWGSTALLAVVTFALYSYRITVEERALLAAIGEPYRRFMITRKRLIPFVY